jgi:predicted AAA+ superfamily ATPase
MAFLCGPRQVGKTTLAKKIATRHEYSKYLSWDNPKDREHLLGGYEQIISKLPINAELLQRPLIIFDEIHKNKKWKNFLKGFIDEYKGQLDIIVTGSAKLNVLRRNNESLAGRYFSYRIHPFSVAEMYRTALAETTVMPPCKVQEEDFKALFEFGGFPEPLMKQDKRFYNRWQSLRRQQILKEDIGNLAQIHELAQLEILAIILQNQASQLTNFSQIGKKIQLADNTIRRWIKVLESFYYCFTIKPWTKNITRSLLKMPKVYLWDWSLVEDIGAKIENFVACHLLKAINYWTDIGLGEYELYYLRDKDGHEADFLITENRKPWILLEVKKSATEPLSKNLLLFQDQIKAEHVLQLAFDLPYVEKDCFQNKLPKIVSMKTFLSQLI